MPDRTDGTFFVRRLPGAGRTADEGLERLQKRLDARDKPALVHDLHDVHLQTTHWMVMVGERLVRETRYLIHDVHVARNVRMIDRTNEVTLDPRRLWILGANYAPGNYWHWHAQVLPAILHSLDTVSADRRSSVSVLTGALTAWQRDGLRAIGLPPEHIVEVQGGRSLRLDRLLYSDLLSSRQAFGKNQAREDTAKLLLAAARGAPSLEPHRRLYVSRRDSARRPLLNERELSDGLGRLGFAPVQNSLLTLVEQVRMFSAAEAVVAPHGAGSTNVLYMRSGAAFVELQQASHVNAGPLSLGKVSNIVPFADVFDDDGGGQATAGWTADVDRVLALAEAAIRSQ
ncbi:glycosyltransferase family 61 protein [Agrococcus sediminis]|uniref:glycosyltransferase family 61 protein n=1 Tax=Agrococcus sediminis TaxID=2599924 RepID=UPI003442C1FD